MTMSAASDGYSRCCMEGIQLKSLIVIVGVVLILGLSADVVDQVGTVAPDFVRYTTDGKQVRLSGFRGQVVLLDFWANCYERS